MEVSVIIPAFNAASFLERAVVSALQHPEVKEILLVEDGSKDATLQLCQQLSQKHTLIKLLRHPNGQNCGAGASRNLGIKNATQDYISFLDADDYFTDIRFQKEKELFKNNPNADGVYGAIGVEYLDAIGAKAWEAKGLDQKTLTTVNKSINSDHLFEYLVGIHNPDGYDGYFSIDALTMRRTSLLESKLLFNTSLRLHQDTVFIWQTAYALKLYTGEFEKPVAIRGVHSENRFIHKGKLYGSRSKQYKVLRDWSIKENMERSVINLFHKKYFRNYLKANKKNKLFQYFKILWVDPETRKRFGKAQLKFVFSSIFKSSLVQIL
jgi:glycosyltransferase involved in cell wall biosynthesis